MHLLLSLLPNALVISRCGAPRMSSPSTFAEWVDAAPALCDALSAGEEGVAERLGSAFATSNGRRGFFATYLSAPDNSVADAAEPPPALLEAIADAPAGPIASICVMNVAMSAATECGHLRNGDADAAAGSALTNKRAVSLVRALVQGQESGPHVGRPSFGAVEQSLMELKQAVDMRLKKDDMFSDDYMNSWTSILEMWKYDEEQEQAVAAAIERCRGAEEDEDSAGMARGDFVGLSAQRGT